MIRPASPADYDVVTTLSRGLGVKDPPPDVERWLRDLAPGTLVYERANEVIGYVTYYRLGVVGHVHTLAVAEHARGGGIGAALMREVASQLAADDVREWHLNVKTTNAPAIRLYERLGLRAAYHSAALRIRWDDELPDEPAVVAATSIAPEDDAGIERTFGFLAGRLAAARARTGRILVQLREGETIAGVAVLDPRLPNAAPFRVIRPGLAAALLRALRPHALADQVELQIVVDNDAPLIDALVAAGADVTFRLIHYVGPTTARTT